MDAISTSLTEKKTDDQLHDSKSGVELIVGPYRSGKTVLVIDKILSQHKQFPITDTIVVVPSQRYKALFESRLLERMKSHQSPDLAMQGLAGLRIVNFYDLCQRLMRQKGSSFRIIPEQIRPAVIARVAERMTKDGQLQSLNEVTAFAGTHQNMIALIDEFERAALAPTDVLRRLEATAKTDSRYIDLARVYEEYWRELERIGLMDQRQVGFRLRDLLSQSESGATNRKGPDETTIGHIFVDGFDRFNKLQLRVFADLASQADNLTVCFDYATKGNQEPDDDYVWKEANYKDVLSILGPRVKLVTAEITPVEVAARKQRQISKFSCTDRFLEMEEIARRVKGQMVRSRVGAQEILVVVRNLKKYKSAIVSAFTDAGIPHYIDDSIEIKKLPFVQFILNLLKLSCDDFPRRTLVDCLRSPYLNRETTKLSKWDVDSIDRSSIKNSIVSSRKHWADLFRDKFARDKEQEENSAPENVDELADDIAELDEAERLAKQELREANSAVLLETISNQPQAPVDNAQQLSLFGLLQPQENAPVDRNRAILAKTLSLIDRLTPPELRTVSEYITWTEDLFEELLSPSISAKFGGSKRKWLEQKALTELRRCFQALLLEEAFLGEEVISFSQFIHRLETLVENGNFRSLPTVANAVTICGADLAPNRLYKHVFVGGLVEGEFPRKASQAGFIGADEIARWATFGVDIANPRFHPAFESALYENLINRSKDCVHLSYPLVEFTGDELLPSFFLTEGKEKFDADDVVFMTGAKTEPISSRNLITGILAHEADSLKYETFSQMAESSAFADVRNLCESIFNNVSLSHGRIGNSRQTVYNGYLVDQVMTGALRVPLPEFWSATKLSDYGKCSFKFWASHVVRAQPIEEPSLGLDPMLLGRTYHKAMELFYRALQQANLTLSFAPDDVNKIFETAVDEALEWLVKSTGFRPSEFFQYDKQEIRFRLRRFLSKEILRIEKDKHGFIPHAFETAFGIERESNSYPALIIKDENRQIAIRGIIDRIDIMSGTESSSKPGVRLVDYKSGSGAIAKEESYSGRSLQLGIYALAVERSIMPGSEALQGVFLSIGSGEQSGSLSFGSFEKQKDEDFDQPKLLELTENHIKKFVDSIARGNFMVAPSATSVCKTCEHNMICRVAEIDGAGVTASSEEFS
jgi:ATP-dependent helicase/DNAse subunit B